MKQQWLERPEAGSLFGYRLISTFARLCGRTAARLVLFPITAFFLVRRGPERRAARAYLPRVLGREPTLKDVAKQFYYFASVLLDRVFLLSESFKRFDVQVHGLDELRAQWAKKQGVLVFGSHLGSFDALRALSEFRKDVKVRVVLDTEQNPEITRFLAAFNPELARSIINARQDGAITALAIKEALDEGALVTLLVDRSRPGNQVSVVDFLGQPAAFPTGPWQIAAALKVPVVLCFGLYGGGNRYDLHFESFADTVRVERKDREASLNAIIQRYADRLAHYTRRAPYNWFNFYDFWHLNSSASDAGSAGGADRAADGGERGPQ
ncbi:acyltransferase [Steroidobacter agaridevorans]|uniref:Acyltransferase n=1 Tax=Steroidobacter agaridevorans TaxID=2695856 RepID=A0A829Y691_9GAMM|nr:acyltransferase [Steroidobacter agaridevorans]GFE78720.1 acyltransferase [Steroidobacter agaridevorans]GFE89347.1 acyltransferase [Steroidobacter agaridevorans]